MILQERNVVTAAEVRAISTSPVDVARVIDGAPITIHHLIIFALCILTMIIDGFDMQVLPYTAPALLPALNAHPADLGPLVSSSIIGMLVSGFVSGMMSDRFGRRAVIVVGLFAFGLFTIAKGLVTTYDQLLVLQFLAGVGLGGVFINALALAAEYAPIRHRRFIVTTVSAAYPFGSIVAGHVTAEWMAKIGWHGVLIVGGVLALIMGGIAAIGLPASARQLVLQGRHPAQVVKVMRRIAPQYSAETIWSSSEERVVGSPIRDVFVGARGWITAILSVAMAISLMTGYFVNSYSPILFNLAGLSPERAAIAASMLHAGAVVGALGWGRLTDWFWPPLVLGLAASIAVICYAMIGHIADNYSALLIILSIAGLGMGVQNAFNGFASSLYPTSMRGTALGTIISLGRVGSVAGPLLGGILIAAKWPTTTLYYVAAATASGMILCMILITALPAARRLVMESRRPSTGEELTAPGQMGSKITGGHVPIQQ